MIGDSAPKLQTGQWVQGEPVREFDTNHVYVIEFWATWCGPCRVSIPHVNELSEQFRDKGVIFIGQNVWDDDSAVKSFVKKMADKMTYRVVLDDKSKEPDGFMSNHWWKRKVNHHSIPNVFVIKQGRVFWIGDLTHLTAQLLNEILTDHYDLTKAAAEYKKQQKENQS
jgi:thiol-disulfide isomerase/thioredoxin